MRLTKIKIYELKFRKRSTQAMKNVYLRTKSPNIHGYVQKVALTFYLQANIYKTKLVVCLLKIKPTSCVGSDCIDHTFQLFALELQ